MKKTNKKIPVVLTSDVRGLGRQWDILEVRPGYFRNYLWPNGIAVLGDKQILDEARAEQAKRVKSMEEMLAKVSEVKALLEGKVLEFARKTNEGGTLYSAIHAKDICDAIREVLGLEIDAKKIEIAEEIKTTGDHSVSVKLDEETTAVVKVKVVEQK